LISKEEAQKQKASRAHMAHVVEECQYVFVMGPQSTARKITNETWTADSGAICHIMNDIIGLYKQKLFRSQ